MANKRLAELPTHQALAEPIRLPQCNNSGALVDLVKLDDMCADHIAHLMRATGEAFGQTRVR